MSTEVKPPVLLLTVREVADRLGVHEQTVRRKIHSGVLPAVRLGARGTPLRIDADELERWLYDGGGVAA
jgi:excisionase family DNA binding protein